MALDFGIRCWHTIFGIQFLSTILALDFYFGGRFGRSILARFWHSILAFDFGNQFWQTILALDFYFGGRFQRSILALDFGSRF